MSQGWSELEDAYLLTVRTTTRIFRDDSENKDQETAHVNILISLYLYMRECEVRAYCRNIALRMRTYVSMHACVCQL